MCAPNGHERVAVFRSAHHRLGQPFAQVCITLRLPVERAPETLHVLSQLANHQIAAVASEVGLVRRVFGPRQQRIGVTPWRKQRTRCVEPVFVGIAEQELAEATHVAILELVLVAHRALAFPIDVRLRNAVDKSKRLHAM
jgi:hypothetical protein